MSYDSRERSTHGGAPVELYEFAIGAIRWRYTSGARGLAVDGNDYAAVPLKRSRIEVTAETARNAITIDCPRDFPVADLFRVAPPSEVIAVTVRRLHRGDADVAVVWMGAVLNCEWLDDDQARLHCEPASRSLKRVGLRRMYGRQCPLVLYRCGVDRATHSTVTTVASIAGLTITLAALAEKPWPGGFVEWAPAGEPVQRRFITGRAGLVLTLSQKFLGLTLGAEVTASPGCDHTLAMCHTVYGNVDNNGGFPFTPKKNPFDGTPVY